VSSTLTPEEREYDRAWREACHGKPLTPLGPISFGEALKIGAWVLMGVLGLIFMVVGLFMPWNPLHLSGNAWWFLTVLIFVCWLIDRNENQQRRR
jgi:hypothetical protein